MAAADCNGRSSRGPKARGRRRVFELHNFQLRRRRAVRRRRRDPRPLAVRRRALPEALGLKCHRAAQPGRPGSGASRSARAEVRDICEPVAGEGGVRLRPDRRRAGPTAAGRPACWSSRRGGEATVAGCGLDLRAHGNVFFMEHTADPRRFYRVSRLLPDAVALVGEPAARGRRGDDQRHPGRRFRPWRHPRGARRGRRRPAAARAADSGVADPADGRGGRAVGRSGHPALG